MMDQNFHHGGVFVDFFNKPASMTDLPAVLSLKTGAPILPVHGRRDGNKYRIAFDAPIFTDSPLSTQEISQKIANTMAGWIKERPVHWLWAHDRWKRQP